MDVVATAPLFVSVLIGTDLAGSTYAAAMQPAGRVPGVSGRTRDTAATAVSGGLLLYVKLVGA